MTTRLVPLDEVDEDLVDGWRRLAEEPAEPNPFAGPDLVLAAHRWLGTGDRVGLVVVERAGAPAFVMPVARSRHFRHIPVPVLTTWSHPYCYLGTPLVHTDSADGAEDLWAEALTGMHGLASMVVLRQVGTDGAVARGYEGAQERRQRTVTALDLPARPVLRRRADGDYLQQLSGTRRRRLRKLRARLETEADGAVDVVDLDQPGPDLDQAVDGFLAMEDRSWKGTDGGAMARHPGHAEFFRDVCRRSAEHGGLLLRELRVGGRPIAWMSILTSGSTMFGFKTTFDAEFHRASPGVVLLLDTVRKFHDEGFSSFDSCLGTKETPFHDLFPDRQPMADALLSLHGVAGEAAVRLVPRAGVAYREAKRVHAALRTRYASRRAPHTEVVAPDAVG